MKKTLGVVALAVIVAASSAFGEPSKVKYIVQLSGDNHVGNNGSGLIPMAYTEGTENPVDFPEGTQVINWAVRVEASGDYKGFAVLGVANAVFDVQLLKDGVPVAIGAGSSTVPGYFSSISEAGELHDTPYPGLGAWPTLAAFTWSYTGVVNAGTTDPGRIFDFPDAGGPHLGQRTYPTAAGYCLPPSGTGPCSTADMSLLVGMGAGYTQFSPEADEGLGIGSKTERAGVGVSGALSFGECTGLGVGPIAEGQINVTGLPGGEYELKVIAGEGNNVLGNDTFGGAGCSSGWGDVSFAGKADSVENGSITFTLTVIEQCEPPVMASATSVKDQGSAGMIGIPLDTTGGNPATVESRDGGPTQLVVAFNKDIAVADGTMDTEVAVSAGSLDGAPMIDGSNLVINLTGVPDASCLMVTIDGLTCAVDGGPGSVSPTSTIMVAVRKGDVNGDGVVNVQDILSVRNQSSGVPVDVARAKYDMNNDGIINVQDILGVRNLSSGLTTPACVN